MKVVTHLLASGGAIPNHPRWPLLVYPAVVADVSPEAFETLFTRNRWLAAWRNGVFTFHHFHFRGDAGTGHKRIASRGALGIVGRLSGGPAPGHVPAGQQGSIEIRAPGAAPRLRSRVRCRRTALPPLAVA